MRRTSRESVVCHSPPSAGRGKHSPRTESPPSHFQLGNAHFRRGQLHDAAKCFRSSLKDDPNQVAAWNNLGITLLKLGKLPEAEACLKRVLELSPEHADALMNLAAIYWTGGRLDEAETVLQKAIQLEPGSAGAHNNLGNVLRSRGQISEAIASFGRAASLQPDDVRAHNNLGTALQSQGRIEEAVTSFRRALASAPDNDTVHSNLLMNLHYLPQVAPAAIFAEHRRWAARHAPVVTHPHDNLPLPDRQLRIGYLSGDFRAHPVAHFFRPVLLNHDRSRFEITCYAEVPAGDAVTAELKASADRWRLTVGETDTALVRMIRDDGIDILVDLAGHTAGNRLPVLAAKPAPVQVTWMGYGGTTGLEAVDYRLTDRHCDPPGETRRFTEELVCLPSGFSCYVPAQDAPPVSDLPALASGSITFGSANNVAKLSERVIAVWSQVLHSVPGSRLLMKDRRLSDAGTQALYRSRFADHGIAAERIEFLGGQLPFSDHLATYARMDIALDCFPYNGSTTTCESLWMGVPVLTLSGVSFVGRMSASILSRVGLASWVTRSEAEFVERAVGAVRDIKGLAALRRNLRYLMAGSTLCDATLHTREVEQVFRSMWHRWCAAQPNSLHPNLIENPVGWPGLSNAKSRTSASGPSVKASDPSTPTQTWNH